MHEAHILLRALGAEQNVTLQTLYHGRSHRASYKVPIVQNLRRLEVYNQQGSDVYFTANETTEDGRDSQHIHKIRTVFVDYDHGVPDSWPLPPSAIIESSPGKAQCYWILKEPLLMCMENLSQWQSVENRWIVATGGDWAARDAARILRLPGFRNHKYAEAPLVSIKSVSERRYTLKEMSDYYRDAIVPEQGQWIPGGGRELPDGLPDEVVRENRFRRYLDNTPFPKVGIGQRNAFFYRKACSGVIDFALDPQLAAGVLTEYSERAYGAQDAYGYDELLTLTNRASTYGKGVRGSVYGKQLAVSIKEEL